MPLERLRTTLANDAVYESLRKAIVGNELKQGQRLDIQAIADQLGVSLTPVRNAVQQLSAEGLIDILPRKGTFVARLSLEHLCETFDIRMALESLAAELAVERITGAELARLDALLEKMSRPLDSDDARCSHERANAEFHQVIFEAAGNKLLTEMHAQLDTHLQIARIHREEKDTALPRYDLEQREHGAIVSAMRSRQRDAAVAAVRAHIGRAKASLIQSLRHSMPDAK